MKIITSIILLSIFFMIGCQDDTTILEPQQSSEIIDLDKMSLQKGGNNYSNLLYDLGQVSDYNVKASKRFLIDGKVGGDVFITITWLNKQNEEVRLKAVLNIPPNAYQGSIKFDMIFDLNEHDIELYPSPFTFNKPVSLDLIFRNVKLGKYRDQDLIFNYVDDLNETVEHEYSKINFKTRTLIVRGAKLNHFSRYGWTRTGK